MKMQYIDFECGECSLKSSAYRSSERQTLPKFCSDNCRLKNARKKYFSWDKATQQERSDHIKAYYEKNVIKSEGCWDWIRKNKTDRYIRMHFARLEPRISIHVYSWKINFGEIPEGMYVLHKCDNPRCSNPQHLFLGTAKDNAIDCKNKKRNVYGVKNKNAKLDEVKVKEIKRLSSLGVTMTRIAKDFNVNISTIERIINNKTWKHLK
jgi:HNH endonuclease